MTRPEISWVSAHSLSHSMAAGVEQAMLKPCEQAADQEAPAVHCSHDTERSTSVVATSRRNKGVWLWLSSILRETCAHLRDGLPCRGMGEMPLEDAAQQVVLPSARCVIREALCRCFPVCVADHGFGVIPKAVHPVVAHAIAELLAGTASRLLRSRIAYVCDYTWAD